MRNEIGFTLTEQEQRIFTKYIWQVGPPVIIGAAITYFLGVIKELWIMLFALTVTASVAVVPFLIMARKKYVFVSPEGLRGYTPSGLKIRIPWDERVVLNSHVAGRLNGLLMTGQDDLRPVFVPLGIAQSPGFRSAVAVYAPEDHPLRRFGDTGILPAPEIAPDSPAGKFVRGFRRGADWMRDLSAFTLVLITVVFGSFGALMIYGILAGAKKDLNLGVLVVGFSFLYLAVAAVWAMATRKRRGSARR